MTEMLPMFTPKERDSDGILDAMLTVKVIEDAAKAANQNLRADLQLEIQKAEDLIGSAFTMRSDKGTAGVTAPSPRAVIEDAYAFATSCDGRYAVAWRERVDLIDWDAAVALLERALKSERIAGDDVLAALRLSEEPILKGDAIAECVDAGLMKITADRAVWLDTGETVPGVSVKTEPRRLQVRFDKDAKKARLAELAATPELDG